MFILCLLRGAAPARGALLCAVPSACLRPLEHHHAIDTDGSGRTDQYRVEVKLIEPRRHRRSPDRQSGQQRGERRAIDCGLAPHAIEQRSHAQRVEHAQP
ncbi:hypothetical protein CNECB9_500002 [Cupriavidus necator]|uniref:Uncharacterized protein n=1 Tax=Cupriavidus necator TaxID=106590 RepID=A0A1K0INQ2_CUPNE|nr:hypothetical protein CNECB9_500002 [Cupriavidus necator]